MLSRADGSNPRRLTFFHDPASPHAQQRDFVIAADIAWSPDGRHLIGLVITGRPESHERDKEQLISRQHPNQNRQQTAECHR